MRKICVFFAVLLAAVLSGCAKTPEYLTSNDWIFCTDCNETIHFGSGGEFSYYCACGSPVGDSDLYDSYSFDENTGEVRLKPEGESFTVLRHDENRLLIDFGDRVKEFYNAENDLLTCVSPQTGYDCDNRTAGYSSYVQIVGMKESLLVTAPAGYDGDDPEYRRLMMESETSDVAYSEWTLTLKDGEADSVYRDITEKEAAQIIDEGCGTAFIWYSHEGKIYKVMFFGSTQYY